MNDPLAGFFMSSHAMVIFFMCYIGQMGLPFSNDPLSGFSVAMYTLYSGVMFFFYYYMVIEDSLSGLSGLPTIK